MHPLEVDGSLARGADKQVVDWTFIPTQARTHARPHAHTHRWWSELPCCVDLYQSRDIKLNWHTGRCTTPTLQSAASGRLSAYVCLYMAVYARYKIAHVSTCLVSARLLRCVFVLQNSVFFFWFFFSNSHFCICFSDQPSSFWHSPLASCP